MRPWRPIPPERRKTSHQPEEGYPELILEQSLLKRPNFGACQLPSVSSAGGLTNALSEGGTQYSRQTHSISHPFVFAPPLKASPFPCLSFPSSRLQNPARVCVAVASLVDRLALNAQVAGRRTPPIPGRRLGLLFWESWRIEWLAI